MVDSCKKIPLVFDCEGEMLVGVLTCPTNTNITVSTALITVPAGGPQYRAGVGRQLVYQAEYLAKEGIATLRFDYRGIGDSDGEFGGFDSVVPDLKAAISTLKEQLPELENIILWGGCNAASAIMMHAWQLPDVKGIVVSTPFLGKHNLAQKAKWLYFGKRIMQKSFWKGRLSWKYNVSNAIKTTIEQFKSKTKSNNAQFTTSSTKPPELKSEAGAAALSSSLQAPGQVIDGMLNGLKRYNGHCLLFQSINTVQSNEFRVLLRTSRAWKKLFKSKRMEICTLPIRKLNASKSDGQTAIQDLVLDWLSHKNFK